ncbi:hypothetical protein H7J08_30420 [Mycobacterium frederiksbergense]|uniref:hypothetical protein n=1 Tax=Mycolicibacterium frederiksbergense TaxID=117567 RepID=UPI0021F32A6D|nr:hypothetical protein [Mycolicibacterium frederiksbergense]MCV7048950.1 hypothetical protein [Mycolicibacterium frederiksbergense]
MEIIYGFLIFAGIFFIAAVILGVFAKRQIDFHLIGASIDDAKFTLETSGVLRSGWKPCDGRGQINIRPGFLLGGRDGRPVLSIDIEADPQGARIQIWLSAWISKFGIMEPAHSLGVMMRRHKIVKSLNAVSEHVP